MVSPSCLVPGAAPDIPGENGTERSDPRCATPLVAEQVRLVQIPSTPLAASTVSARPERACAFNGGGEACRPFSGRTARARGRAEESMPAERFDFPNARGQNLAALLDRPAGEPRAYALFAHCFTCGKDIHAAKRIAEGLTALGIAVLRFDFTGLGSSEGEFANTTFSSNIVDLVAAANELRRRAAAPAILIGHSLGGTAVLAAAAEVAEARAVVTIAAPCDPAHVTGLFKD